jgi:hypothetical protein
MGWIGRVFAVPLTVAWVVVSSRSGASASRRG